MMVKGYCTKLVSLAVCIITVHAYKKKKSVWFEEMWLHLFCLWNQVLVCAVCRPTTAHYLNRNECCDSGFLTDMWSNTLSLDWKPTDTHYPLCSLHICDIREISDPIESPLHSTLIKNFQLTEADLLGLSLCNVHDYVFVCGYICV